MDLFSLIAAVLLAAILVQLSHYWSRAAFVVVLVMATVLVTSTAKASTNSIDILTVSLALDPAGRDYLILGLALAGVLALVATYEGDRTNLGFFFGSWVGWMVALVVNNFVVAVFAWTIGLVAPVLSMRPRRFHRASGAAYYLVFVVVAGASLTLANRFIELYPLAPERTLMIQFAVLFLCWGFGLLLSIAPLHLWVAPMTDDAPVTTAASILALGQPIGVWLLYRLLQQNPWLVERSELLTIAGLGGAACILIGALMALVEQRGGRLLGYAAIFSMGFIILDISRASPESLVDASLETASRALSLCILAAMIVIGRNVENRYVKYASVVGLLIAGLSLTGLRLGVDLFERWRLWVDWAAGDTRMLLFVTAAQIFFVVGLLRFVRGWMKNEEFRASPKIADVSRARPRAVPVEIDFPAKVKQDLEAPAARPNLGVLEHVAETRIGARPVRVVTPTRFESVTGSEVAGTNGGETPVDTEPGENGAGESLPPINGSESDEYVFEEHVRELADELQKRLKPYVLRGARSLPSGTLRFVLFVLGTSRAWTSFGLVVVLLGTLIIAGMIPSVWIERALNDLGVILSAR